ncbi:MAG: GAF domain-containing sensor histidine kinase [Cyanobacteria bacterium P01_C01_bin.121]
MIYGTANNEIVSNTPDDSSFQPGLSCLVEGLSPDQRDRNRSETLARLNLLGNDTVPVFEEATQNISRLLAMPICILSVMDSDVQRFKSVVGLSSLGLMNQLAAARSLPKNESFCTHVIDSGRTFVLPDATSHPAFSRSLLVQQYGIQSYLGVPLITTEGCCIGTLAVMDLLPHEFTAQEIAFLELSARWSMSEFEKQQALSHRHQQETAVAQPSGDRESTLLSRVNQVRFDLIVQLTQELRNPLTSVTGMASMLSREIYGPLSEKQQEYANIVLASAQQLLNTVNEIVEIGDLQEDSYQLAIASADIEMVAQQALGALIDIAKQQDLQLKLTVEPGSRLWNFDKRVLKQLIYHLVFSIIKMSTAGSTIRLHISRKDDSANIALWVSNPWLGEDLPQAVIAWDKSHSERSTATSIDAAGNNTTANSLMSAPAAANAARMLEDDLSSGEAFEAITAAQKVDASRQELGLLLSRHLTEMHGGDVTVQGSNAAGYRYIITLPNLPLS